MRIDVFVKKARSYIALIRPFTLLAPIIVSISIMFASFFYHEIHGELFTFFIFMMLPACLSLAVLNAASNTLNQYSDVDTDKISKPYRPLTRGLISKKEALFISLGLYFISFLLSIRVNAVFTLFVVLISLFTVSYSLKPRFKNKIFVNQLWVGIPRGMLGILASWSVFGDPFQPLPLTIGTIAMVFLIGGSITKDINDMEADRKTGTKTLINTYGVKKAAYIVLPFILMPFIMIPLLVDIKILDGYLLPLTILVLPAFLVFYLMIKDDKKISSLENTGSWALMYVTYFFFAFGFSVLTVMNQFIS